ncbi:unnamed protein product, partial [Linum tenue]
MAASTFLAVDASSKLSNPVVRASPTAAGKTTFLQLPLKLRNPGSLKHASSFAGSRRSFSCTSQAASSDDARPPSKVQELHVYEMNERDRGSPAVLRLSQKPTNSFGDLVPFSNKVDLRSSLPS